MTIRDEARAYAEQYAELRGWTGYEGYEIASAYQEGYIAGASWASEQADREPSDAEVEAAGEAIWGRGWRVPKEVVRAALLAAQAVRHAD